MIIYLLPNNGTDCYINSSIQCILRDYNLTNFLYTNQKQILEYTITMDHAQTPENFNIIISVGLVRYLTSILYKLYSPEVTINEIDKTNFSNDQLIIDASNSSGERTTHYIPINMTNLKKIILSTFGDNNSFFIGQQDAHEFIIKILNHIHTGLEYMGLLANDMIMNENGMLIVDSISKNQQYQNYTTINQQYGGTTVDLIKCTECGNVSSNEVVYDMLELTLPVLEGKHVYDLLNEHFKEEKFDDDVKLTCDVCEQKYTPIKKTVFKTVPRVLICTLKRFDDAGRKRKEKIILDKNIDINVVSNVNYKFRLQSIIYHMGSTISSGHYVSLINKENGKWYIYNDEDVKEYEDVDIDLTKINSSDSYVLIYSIVDQ